jgi:hypothetical protein
MLYFTAIDAHGDISLWEDDGSAEPRCILIRRGTHKAVWDAALDTLCESD